LFSEGTLTNRQKKLIALNPGKIAFSKGRGGGRAKAIELRGRKEVFTDDKLWVKESIRLFGQIAMLSDIKSRDKGDEGKEILRGDRRTDTGRSSRKTNQTRRKRKGLCQKGERSFRLVEGSMGLKRDVRFQNGGIGRKVSL